MEIICYHCQQAAEKAIKALYLALDIPGGIPRKHDLSFLLQQLSKRITIPEAIEEAAEELDPYGIIFRYPSENHVDDEMTGKALGYAEAIMDWVKRQIS